MEKNGSSTSFFSSRFDRRINYLELPVDLVLHLSSTTSRNFSVGAGLVPAFGVSDVFTYELNTSGQPQDAGKSYVGFGGNHYYKRMTLGLNFLGSAQFKKLVLTADYNVGLTSITQYSYLIPRLLNRTLAISVTYLLWQKRQSTRRD